MGFTFQLVDLESNTTSERIRELESVHHHHGQECHLETLKTPLWFSKQGCTLVSSATVLPDRQVARSRASSLYIWKDQLTYTTAAGTLICEL